MHTTLLISAISEGNIIKTQSLFHRYGITSATTDPDTGIPFLFIAIDFFQNDLFKYLVNMEKDNILQIKDWDGNTALMEAFKVKNIKAITFLLQSYPGLSILRNKNGKSPVMCACQYGLPITFIEQLLSFGAELNEIDNDGSTALH